MAYFSKLTYTGSYKNRLQEVAPQLVWCLDA